MKTESSESPTSYSNTWTTIEITSLPWFPGENDISDADVSCSFWIMKSLRLLFFGVTNEDEDEELPAEEDGNIEEDEWATAEEEEAISVELLTAAEDPLGILDFDFDK